MWKLIIARLITQSKHLRSQINDYILNQVQHKHHQTL